MANAMLSFKGWALSYNLRIFRNYLSYIRKSDSLLGMEIAAFLKKVGNPFNFDPEDKTRGLVKNITVRNDALKTMSMQMLVDYDIPFTRHKQMGKKGADSGNKCKWSPVYEHMLFMKLLQIKEGAQPDDVFDSGKLTQCVAALGHHFNEQFVMKKARKLGVQYKERLCGESDDEDDLTLID